METLSPGPLQFDGKSFVVIAGPCSIESEHQFRTTAQEVKRLGATALRGGIYKLRTDPKSFQGLGSDAYPIALQVKQELKLPFISEITDPRQISTLGEVADVFQVGARNMYNYDLLKELGRQKKPVLLKRAFSATIDEWLFAAEYVTRNGNPQVILCERGIRSFEKKLRNTLDLGAVAYAKAHSSFPVVVDPSHGTGRPELIKPMSMAAVAAGADGILVEVHHEPEKALSDRDQALSLADFSEVMTGVKAVLGAIGKKLANS